MTNLNLKRITLMTAPALLAVALGSNAMAQSASPLSGVYVSGGTQQVQSKKTGADLNALNARAGYQVNKYFAVEGEAAYGLGKDSTPAGDYKLTNKVGAYAVGTLPVSERVSLIGRAGLSDTQLKRPAGADKTETGTSRDVGVGAQVNITQGLAVRTDYTHSEFLGKKNGSANTVGLNLVQKF
jgi:opacity protein-like surface antigen